jgi:hypothetical protein
LTFLLSPPPPIPKLNPPDTPGSAGALRLGGAVKGPGAAAAELKPPNVDPERFPELELDENVGPNGVLFGTGALVEAPNVNEDDGGAPPKGVVPTDEVEAPKGVVVEVLLPPNAKGVEAGATAGAVFPPKNPPEGTEAAANGLVAVDEAPKADVEDVDDEPLNKAPDGWKAVLVEVNPLGAVEMV